MIDLVRACLIGMCGPNRISGSPLLLSRSGVGVGAAHTHGETFHVKAASLVELLLAVVSGHGCRRVVVVRLLHLLDHLHFLSSLVIN